MKKVVLFWSAGKDSAMALHNLLNDKSFELVALVTTLNEEYKRISMHGIPEQLLDRQCAALGLPVIKMWVPNLPDNNSYEYCFLEFGFGFEPTMSFVLAKIHDNPRPEFCDERAL